MIVLGIESSCDETAAALVENGNTLLSNVVASSMELHAPYGGVIPEIAARSHLEVINQVIEQAIVEGFSLEIEGLDYYQKHQLLEVAWSKIDAIAVTYGAGLGGCLLIGVMTARTYAITKGKPLYAINHVEGHVYANFLTEYQPRSLQTVDIANFTKVSLPWKNSLVAGALLSNFEGRQNLGKISPDPTLYEKPVLQTLYSLPASQPKFPLLALIVSGGHSQLVFFRDHFDYTLLGQTQDDAIGEAFDKVAKIIGLPYPGGPAIAKVAPLGDAHKYSFPKSRMSNKYDFSFSGIKTAVLRRVQEVCGKSIDFPSRELAGLLNESQRNDIAASFQRIAIETVVDKTVMAFEEYSPVCVVIAGGVAAAQELRSQLSKRIPIAIEYTDIKLCTDNGAMIATLGCFHIANNRPTADPYTLVPYPGLSM
jgi:N6-L-threonylcarbamoyladenine synthase